MKPLNCKDCNESYFSTKDLSTHILLKHTSIRPSGPPTPPVEAKIAAIPEPPPDNVTCGLASMPDVFKCAKCLAEFTSRQSLYEHCGKQHQAEYGSSSAFSHGAAFHFAEMTVSSNIISYIHLCC